MRLRIKYDSGARSLEALPTIYTLMDYCKEWFSALETPIPIVMFCGMGNCLYVGYYAVDHMRRTRQFAPGLGVAAIGLTALTGAMVSYYINPCFLGRYAFPGFGSLALLYAAGMPNIDSRRIKAVVMAVVMGSFLLQYFLNGYKRYSLPFVNTDALTSREQLAQREGNVWYMCFQGSEPESFAEWYDYEEALSFHYMYYDFVIWQLTPK